MPLTLHLSHTLRRASACAVGLGLLAVGAGAQSSRLQSLEERVEALEREHELELEDLRAELDDALSRLRAVQANTIANETASIFNPAIAMTGTFTARSDDRPAFEDDDPGNHRIDDRFAMREAEVELWAPITPYADGVLVLEVEQEDGEYQTGIEEGYVTLRRLPLLDAAPLGLALKIGVFRASFNRMNRLHLHDLSQPTFPRSLQKFLGYHGFYPTGISGRVFLPSPSEAVSLQATVEVTNGGDVPPQSLATESDISTIGQVRSFIELSPASTFDLGVSTWTDGSERSLHGADFYYKWIPPGRSTYRSFTANGELFVGDFDQTGLDERPIGYNVGGQYQLNTTTYLGLRYDHSQELDDADLETDTWGAYLTYYSSEFLRFRLGYEYASSDVDRIDDRDTGFFEVNFTFGAHPVHPYWVHP